VLFDDLSQYYLLSKVIAMGVAFILHIPTKVDLIVGFVRGLLSRGACVWQTDTQP